MNECIAVNFTKSNTPVQSVEAQNNLSGRWIAAVDFGFFVVAAQPAMFQRSV
jgi:hypothetical protein